MTRKKFRTIEDVIAGRPDGSKLTPLEFVYKPNGVGKRTRYVKCVCECGSEREMSVDSCTTHLSCGCIRISKFCEMATKYYPVIPKLLVCYRAMIDRCYNEKNKVYYRYGGKGVKVCEEWREGYQKFLDWAIVNGYEDGLCLDKDIKGDGTLYSPETCCWITNLENQSYKSNSVKYEYNGELLTLFQIGRTIGISGLKLYNRINRGTTLGQAIELIKNKTKRKWPRKSKIQQ